MSRRNTRRARQARIDSLLIATAWLSAVLVGLVPTMLLAYVMTRPLS